VEELILNIIKRVSAYVRDNEAEFIRQVRESSEARQESAVKSHRKQLVKNEKRHAELDKIISKLYEDKVGGSLSDKRFETLTQGYEKEQEQLERQSEVLRAEITAFEADSMRADKFIEVVKKYTDFTELTTPMLNEYVEKVIVHAPDKSSGKQVQKVDIYLNFIGMFGEQIPDEPVSPDEAAAQEVI